MYLIIIHIDIYVTVLAVHAREILHSCVLHSISISISALLPVTRNFSVPLSVSCVLLILRPVFKYCPDINNQSNRRSFKIAVLCRGKMSEKILITSIRNGNLELVEDLLKNGADVNILEDNSLFRNSILHSAVYWRQVQMAKLLINYGANVNVKNCLGETPIVNAIYNRDTKMIELLLTNGADIKEDPKILLAAVETGNLKIVEDILTDCADVNMLLFDCTEFYTWAPPLHKAVKRKQVQMVELLINYGANVNVKNSQGETPIVNAIKNRDTKMIELLLTNGADIKEDPKVVCTAVSCGNLKLVKDLLKNGAHVNMLHGGLDFIHNLLHKAVDGKQVQMAKLLINYGANVNVKNSQGETPIVNAIKNRNTKLIELLLTNGADIKEDPKVVGTAVRCGNQELVEDLLKNGADVNMLHGGLDFRHSLLHKAVDGKQVQMAKLLINYGANVNVKDTREKTPIVTAILNRDTEMIELLLTNGADIKEDPKVVCTAVRCGNLELVEDLLKNGADINALDNMYFRFSLLHEAVKRKQVQMVKLLINYRANVNVKNSQGETPIVNAIQNTDTKMIELLLTNGADIKEDPKVVCTAVRCGNLEIVEDLLKNGADINALDNMYFSFSLLHYAVLRKQLQMVQLLINYGANVNVKDTREKTPIVDAIQNKDKKIIKLLLSNGADIKEDPKVLCAAVENGNLKIVEDILTDGADVNMLLIPNSSIGRRFLLLHKAVMQKQVKMAKLLLKYGANVNAKDSEGATPIFYAINKRDTEMIELLLINGADIKVHSNTHRVKSPTTKLLKQHIAKMKAAGLYVSERNLWWISRDYKISHFLNKCDAEVQIMKRTKIDNSCASFYDILTKNTSELAKNKSIVKALKSDDYKIMFPIYASMIDSRFRRGVEREELMKQVRKKFLPSLFKSLNELPFLCTEKIFSYLSDKDLRILLVACKLFNK
ncbi:uncharacterized protein LOC143211647 [Lasioglossum baleicum]|uniref:uncharacterized protein LOC143211647 n=1 Tax=Lasioglossum baleicum TaxID=434251 RepID=UPI003FCC5507